MKKFYTTHEAAKVLGITPTTVIAWVKEKKLKIVHTLGGHRRIPAKEIEKIKSEMGYDDIDDE